MKKLTCLFSVLVLLFMCFIIPAFAVDNSYQTEYFNKLVEIREKPGLLRILFTGRDNNGYSTDTICYALNDYNSDGTPELVVYGTNIANEAGENYRVFTFADGKLKEFKVVPHKGPSGENVDYKNQPYWPYYTEFFSLPDGYTDTKTNDLVWIMKNEAGSKDFWATASMPDDKETVFEAKFDFDKMTVDILPVVYSEGSDSGKYDAAIESWEETHQLTISHDEYGRKIETDNTALWKQLSGDETEVPQLTVTNMIIIFINKLLNR